MTQIMKLTTSDDEIYDALTQKRQELMQQFSTQFGGVQNAKSIEYRDNCLGMLNLDASHIDVAYYTPSANPRAPNLNLIQGTVNALGNNDISERNAGGAAGGAYGQGYYRPIAGV